MKANTSKTNIKEVMMALEDTLYGMKSKHILKHGESIWYGCFDYLTVVNGLHAIRTGIFT